jgi:hypothetical protein
MSYTRLPGKSANAVAYNAAVDDYEAARTAYEAHQTAMRTKQEEAERVETEYVALRSQLVERDEPPTLSYKMSWPHKSSWTDAPEAQALAELDEWYKTARAALQRMYGLKEERARVLAAMENAPHTLHDEHRAMYRENQRLMQKMNAAETVLREWKNGAKRARRE